jgi:phosphoglycolate phosphatase
MPLLYACEHFDIAPHEMLLIGDSLNDTQAARAAGCHIFCVPYGYNEGRDVRELDCDAIVSSLYQATKLIQKPL